MKQIIIFLFCFAGFYSFGQQDSVDSKGLQLGYTDVPVKSPLINPLFIIKGDDIRRFPTLNFLEAVNGLFPWVFSFAPNANDFLYVVDGNIFADINAISLYSIEEVTFVRGSLEAGNYPFAKRGCFIIRTKSGSAASGFEFNANTGFQYLKSGRPYPVTNTPSTTFDSANTRGMLQSYQLSYSGKTGKANYYLSGNFAYEKDPPVLLQQYNTAYTGSYKYKSNTNVFRFHAGASIPILPTLRLDLQGIAAIQRTKINSYNSISLNNSVTNAKNELPERYYSLYSSISWKISKLFSNTFSFAYSNDKERLKTESFSANDLPVFYNSSVTDTTTIKRGYIQSNTAYQSKGNAALKVKAGILLRYNFLKFRKAHLGLTYRDNQPYSAEGSTTWGRMRLITGVPYINLEYKNLLSFYGGLQLIIKNTEVKGNWNIKNGSKRLPYAGAVFSAMNLLSPKKILNRLDVGIHYSERNSNISDYYRLEKQEIPDQFGVTYVYNLNSPNDFFKDKLFSLQLTTGFSEDRFMIGAEWFKGKDGKWVAHTLSSFPPSVIYMPLEVETKGISIFGKAELLQREKYSWNMRVNAVKQDTKILDNYTPPDPYYPVTVGMQNNIVITDLFVQLTAVMGLKKDIRSPANIYAVPKKGNDLSLSHVLVGYNFSADKKWISNIQAFVQAKNIIASKDKDSYWYWPKYIGIGLNAGF